MATTPTKREFYEKRLSALKTEYASWRDHHREIADVLLPRRGRFLTSDRNKGSKRNGKIKNATATRALRALASGLQAGLTSPARPWFRLQTRNRALMKNRDVRIWLSEVENAMRDMLSRSNLYTSLAQLYEDIAAFGIGCMFAEADLEDGIRFYVSPIGSYYVANGPTWRVDTVYWELKLTVQQLVRKFGKENCSQEVRRMFEDGDTEKEIEVCHVVEPRAVRDPFKRDRLNMPFRSLWFEKGKPGVEKATGDPEFLGESGYRTFPAFVPRWGTTGEDTYGYSPGMDALPDIQMLQQFQSRRLTVLDKITDPPLVGPGALRNEPVSQIPGALNYIDSTAIGAELKALYTPDARALTIREEIAEIKGEIRESFHADLFLMISYMDKSGVTAEEIRAKEAEKMLQLGPFTERFQDELLDPLIDKIFDVMVDGFMLPPAPPGMEGEELTVEYTSVLVQGQRALGVVTVERFLAFTGNLASTFPGVLDKIDADKALDEYAGMTAVPPTLILPDEVVAQRRAQREQQAAAQRAAESADGFQKGAAAAKLLSETNTEDPNALTRLLGAVGAA